MILEVFVAVCGLEVFVAEMRDLEVFVAMICGLETFVAVLQSL